MVVSRLPDSVGVRIENPGHKDVSSREVEWHGVDEGGEEGEDDDDERHGLVHCGVRVVNVVNVNVCEDVVVVVVVANGKGVCGWGSGGAAGLGLYTPAWTQGRPVDDPPQPFPSPMLVPMAPVDHLLPLVR